MIPSRCPHHTAQVWRSHRSGFAVVPTRLFSFRAIRSEWVSSTCISLLLVSCNCTVTQLSEMGGRQIDCGADCRVPLCTQLGPAPNMEPQDQTSVRLPRTQPRQQHDRRTAGTAAGTDAPQHPSTLHITRDDSSGIVTVAPDRPHKRNAINRSMWEEVGTVMEELDRDDSVRCIVLRANGPGADISEFSTERSVRHTVRVHPVTI